MALELRINFLASIDGKIARRSTEIGAVPKNVSKTAGATKDCS